MTTNFENSLVWKFIIIVFSIIILCFLLFPVVYIIIWSFTGTSGFVSLTNQFSFQWFVKVYTDESWLKAISTSFFYAIVSTSIAIFLTLIYYYYSLWYRNMYQLAGFVVTIFPLFFPLLVYALALKMLSSKFLIPEAGTIVIGHIALIIPIQYLIIEGSNEKLKMDWLYSSVIMGAKHVEIIRRIVIPNISITLIIAFVCGFLYSFDEIVISNFIIDSGNNTIPKKIWLDINRDINPSSGVIYSTLLGISLIVLTAVYFYTKFKIDPLMKRKNKRRLFLFKDLKSKFKSGFIVALIDVIFEYFAYGHIIVWKVFISFIVGVGMYEIGLLFFLQVYIWSREIIDKIYIYRKEEHSKYRELAMGLLSYKIDNSVSELRNFFHNKDGVSVSIPESEKLNELLFERNKEGCYFGTDSNVPSKFKELYPNYLISSQQSKSSARILLCSQQELGDDFNNNKTDFKEFYEWHYKHKVTLLNVDKMTAETKKNTLHLLNTDIGIWDDDYVVIFKPEPPETIHYWFKSYFVIDETKGYVKFFINLLDEARQIKLFNNNLQIEPLSTNMKEEISNQIKSLWNI